MGCLLRGPPGGSRLYFWARTELKSTILKKSISSLLTPGNGTVTFEGTRLNEIPPHQVIRIRFGPAGRAAPLPGDERRGNLIVGSLTREAKAKRNETMAGSISSFHVFWRGANRPRELCRVANSRCSTIGRGLMSLPKLLIFDEPSLGLAPILVMEIFKMVEMVNKEGVTVLLRSKT